jgi:hypothetical protein
MNTYIPYLHIYYPIQKGASMSDYLVPLLIILAEMIVIVLVDRFQIPNRKEKTMSLFHKEHMKIRITRNNGHVPAFYSESEEYSVVKKDNGYVLATDVNKAPNEQRVIPLDQAKVIGR